MPREFDNKLIIRIADWQADKNELKKLRKAIFIDEQNVPETLEWDGYDEHSIHFIASMDEKVVATARLKHDGQLGRMAVAADYRHQGIGSQLLTYILEYAAAQNRNPIYLHAQLSAIAFYQRSGFYKKGDVFFEADIPHILMLQKSRL